jgi:hypothetical protein
MATYNTLTFRYPEAPASNTPPQVYTVSGYYSKNPEGDSYPGSGPPELYQETLSSGTSFTKTTPQLFIVSDTWTYPITISTDEFESNIPFTSITAAGSYLFDWKPKEGVVVNEANRAKLVPGYTTSNFQSSPHTTAYEVVLSVPGAAAQLAQKSPRKQTPEMQIAWAPIATTILLGAIMIILLVAVCLYFTRT